MGSASETVTIALQDTNVTGYLADLGSKTLTITDTVEVAAQATINSPKTIDFGKLRVGSAASQTVSITNSASAPAAYLDAHLNGLSGGTTESGAISLLAPGGTDATSISVGIDTTTGGDKGEMRPCRAAKHVRGAVGKGFLRGPCRCGRKWSAAALNRWPGRTRAPSETVTYESGAWSIFCNISRS